MSVVNTNEFKRYGGTDFLKIVAIVLICFSHAAQTVRELELFSRMSISNGITYCISCFGTIGNILFIICSCYFLVDSNKTRKEKAINILLDSSIISIIIFLGFLISGKRFGWQEILTFLFPDLYGIVWFVPCYVVFYLLSPIIKNGLRCLSKKQHFLLIVISIICYGFLSLISHAPVNSYLLQFFYIFSIVAFIKWYIPSYFSHKKAHFFVALFGIVICFGLYVGFIMLRNYDEYFERIWIFQMLNPILVLSLISFFALFEQMKFTSRFISYLSTCSLFVYVIHENVLLRSIVRVDYYNYVITNYGENMIIPSIIFCGLFMFIAGFMLAVIYKETLHRTTSLVSLKICNFLRSLYNRLYCKLFN